MQLLPRDVLHLWTEVAVQFVEIHCAVPVLVRFAPETPEEKIREESVFVRPERAGELRTSTRCQGYDLTRHREGLFQRQSQRPCPGGEYRAATPTRKAGIQHHNDFSGWEVGEALIQPLERVFRRFDEYGIAIY